MHPWRRSRTGFSRGILPDCELLVHLQYFCVQRKGGDGMGRIIKSECNSASTSWAAISLSVLLLLYAGAGALAQTRDQKQIDTLVRKAEMGEAANGFCARTSWPPGDSHEDFTAFLRGAKVGSWIVRTHSKGDCVFNRVTDVHQENGGKCVGYTFYVCPKSGACGLGKSIDCLDQNGTFVSRRNG
jgi:hypothetical protein